MPDEIDAEKLYEDGKHRRYNLLFAVNGGAFAVAKLKGQAVLGGLTIHHVALGMVIFTGLMTYDIWRFGERMRKRVPDVFGCAGKRVLLGLSLLISVGWCLVGRPW